MFCPMRIKYVKFCDTDHYAIHIYRVEGESGVGVKVEKWEGSDRVLHSPAALLVSIALYFLFENNARFGVDLSMWVKTNLFYFISTKIYCLNYI